MDVLLSDDVFEQDKHAAQYDEMLYLEDRGKLMVQEVDEGAPCLVEASGALCVV